MSDFRQKSSLLQIPRVMLEDFLAESASVDVGVDFGGADILVA